MWRKAIVSILGGAAVAAGQASSVTSVTRTATATATSGNNACAQLSASQASYLSASPSATSFSQFRYDYSQVRQCAHSIPLDQSDAYALIDGLSAFLQFQSDLAYLANPPSGYLLRGVDLLGGLRNVNASVQSGNITNEWDFQVAIQNVYGAAHDGHLSWSPDTFALMEFRRPVGTLTSVSWDGVQVPQVYFYSDVIMYLNGSAPRPQAITQINGVNTTAFVDYEQQNKTFGVFQDPDALYNIYFFSFASGAAGVTNFPGLFGGYSLGGDPGPNTTIRYENGSTVTVPNFGTVNVNFTGITNGNDIYQNFLNYTVKEEMLSASASASSMSATATSASRSASATSSSTPRPTQINGYPYPIAISSDQTASGYFLNEPGFENTAVLVLRSMSEDDPDSFQATVQYFLNRCRATNKTHLVLDIQGNGGGTVALGYDTFRQLFPSLDPYGAGNYRAHESFELLGETITPIGERILQQNPNNFSTFYVNSAFSATTFLNATDQPYTNFSSYYGPITAPNNYGNYTNLNRVNLANPAFNEAFGSIIVTGEANSTNHAPQPFRSENIIVLSDGKCGSTCTIMTHFLKWQGKVKSIAVGGRPTNQGPMQAIGGIKGSQVYYLQNLAGIIFNLYETLNSTVLSSFNGTAIDTINQLAGYVSLRTSSAGQTITDVGLNYQNNIAEGDASRTPLQYVYEAADCRMYYQPRHVANITYQWLDVAANAFGLNGTAVFGRCTLGSTNSTSSLSGNATLFNNGVGQNSTLTGFLPPGTNGTRR